MIAVVLHRLPLLTWVAFAALLLLGSARAEAQWSLQLGQAEAPPGEQAAVAVDGDGGFSALQLDVVHDGDRLLPGAFLADVPGSLRFDREALAADRVRLLVYETACPAPRGTAGFSGRMGFEVLEQAAPGSVPLLPEGLRVADPAGQALPASASAGQFDVLDAAEAPDAPLPIPALHPVALLLLGVLLLVAAVVALRRRIGSALVVLLGCGILLTGMPGTGHGRAGQVPGGDLAATLDAIAAVILGRSGGDGSEDCNGDGVVDALDLGCALNAFCGPDPEPNQPPTLQPIDDRELRVGEVLLIQPRADDPDLPADTLDFALDVAPAGLSLDRFDGRMVWAPTAGQEGVYPLTLTVADAAGASAAVSFEVRVESIPRAPSLSPVADRGLLPGELLTFGLQATDPDLPDDELQFSLPLAPAGMSVDAAAGTLSWTPTAQQIGQHDVTARVEDATGLAAEQRFVVRVSLPNRAPQAADDEVRARRGETTTIDGPGVLANDTDPDGDPLSAQLVEGPQLGTVQLRPDGGFDYTPRAAPPGFDAELVTSLQRIEIDGIERTWYLQHGTVVAGDLTGDGRSELVGIGRIPALNSGAGYGRLMAMRLNEQGELEHLWNRGGSPGNAPDLDFATFVNVNEPALGDLDGDGVPEVVMPAYCQGEVLIFSNLGEPLVSTQAGRVPLPGQNGPEFCDGPTFATGLYGRVALVDLSGNGFPEIVTNVGGLVRVFATERDGDGALSGASLLWEAEAPFGAFGAVRIWSFAIADVDLDGRPNIWHGGTLFDADGEVLWAQGAINRFWEGHHAVANLDDDPFAELVFWGNNFGLMVLDHDGSCRWQARRSGAPAAPECPQSTIIPDIPFNVLEMGLIIGDVAGDGVSRILIGAQGRGSAQTGPSLNRVIAYNPDGSLFWSVPTRLSNDEYVRVTHLNAFDLTGNGVMEVIATGAHGTLVLDGRNGQPIFELLADDTNPGEWHGTAGPHTHYSSVVDLDGDGVAELILASNVYPGIDGDRPSGVFIYRHPQNAWMPARRVWNQMPYTVTNVDPDLSIPSPAVPNWLSPGLNNFGINALLPSEPGALDRFTYRASDGELLSDEATVWVDLRRRNRPPQFIGTPAGLVGVGFAYRSQVAAFDPDPGDALSLSLDRGPDGLTLGADRVLRWQPDIDDLGRHPVLLSARDLEGAITTLEFEIEVVEPQPVPDLLGLSESDALAALQAADFEPGTRSERADPVIPADRVAAQQPLSGAVAAPGSAVAFTLSTGPGPGDRDEDGDGFTPNQGDCNDDDASIYPGAPDPVGDGIDSDCNGVDGSRPIMALEIDPPALTLLTGEQRVLVAYARFDDGSVQRISGAVDWTSSDAGVAVDADGRLTAVAAGSSQVQASLDGVIASITVDVAAVNPDDDQPPVVELVDPIEGQTVLEALDVVGSVRDADLVRWQLELLAADEDQGVLLAEGDSERTEAVLGRFDPGVLLNGYYQLRLRALDAGGNESLDERTVLVDGEQKVGLFTMSFTDLVVPLGRLPIRVERIYDSRDRRQGDFGFGWRLGLRSLELRCTGALGERWFVARAGLSYLLLSEREQGCAVTLPDGRLEAFDFRPSATESPVVPFISLRGSLVARPNTLGRLEILDNPNLLILDPQPGEVQLLDDQTLTVFDPQRFRYTAPDETVYEFEAGQLVRVREPNGSWLEFGADGINHSSGSAIAFERDAAGRITRLTDLAGEVQRYDYSAAGDLVGHVDALGNRTRMFYNRNHGLLRIEDPLGRTALRNEYDARGRLIAVTDGEGNRTEYLYDDEAGTLTRIFPDGSTRVTRYDALGKVSSDGGLVTIDGVPVFSEQRYEYDALGNPTRVESPDGDVREIEWQDASWTRQVIDPDGLALTSERELDADGQVLRAIDPLGRERSFSYDARGNVTASAGPGGADVALGYDSGGGLPTAVTTASGDRFEFQRDAFGRVQRRDRFDAQGRVVGRIEFVRDAMGRVVEQTEVGLNPGEVSRTTRFEFDALGQLLRQIDPFGAVTSHEYDAAGRRVAMVDPLGARTEWIHDDRGLPIEQRWPDGAVERFEYDYAGRRTRHVDPDGVVTEWRYDELGRELERRVGGEIKEQRILSPGGRLDAMLDGLGQRTDYDYDAAGRLLRIRLPAVFDAVSGTTLRPERMFEYDALGRTAAQIDELGRRTEYEYDDAGYLRLIRHADASESARVNDPAGRPLTAIDEIGQETRYEYDPRGRLVRILQPPPAPGEPAPETRLVRDSFGQVVARIDALGRVTAFEYDAAGREIRKTLPGGQSRRLERDAAGRLVRRIDYDGTVTEYDYDSRGRMIARRGPLVEETQRWSPGGRRIETDDGRGTVTYSYDDQGRLTSWSDADGLGIAYGFDAADRLISMTTPFAVTLYHRDAIGRLAALETPQGLTEYRFDRIGNPVLEVRPNGLVIERDHDLRDRLSELRWRAPDDTLLERYRATWSDRSQLLALERLDGSLEAWQYDAIGRLVRAERDGAAAFALDYEHDAVGNRVLERLDGVERSFSYGLNDELLTAGADSYVYDARGQRIAAVIDGQALSWSWDEFGRLASVSSSGSVTRFDYDIDGHRIAREAGGQSQRLLVDPHSADGLARVVAEVDSAGQAQAEWAWGIGLVEQRRDGAVHQALADPAGSIASLSNAGGSLSDRWDYLPFGQVLQRQGGTDNPFLFKSERFEPATTWYDKRARNYDPAGGVFASRDPFAGFEARPFSFHPYQFADADPVNMADPLGLFSIASLSVAQSIQGTLRASKLGTAAATVCKARTVVEVANAVVAAGEIASLAHTIFGAGPSIGVARKRTYTVEVGDGIEAEFEYEASKGFGSSDPIAHKLSVALKGPVKKASAGGNFSVSWQGGVVSLGGSGGADFELAELAACSTVKVGSLSLGSEFGVSGGSDGAGALSFKLAVKLALGLKDSNASTELSWDMLELKTTTAAN